MELNAWNTKMYWNCVHMILRIENSLLIIYLINYVTGHGGS